MSGTAAERIRWIDSEVRSPHNRVLLACLGPWDDPATARVVREFVSRGGVDWAVFVESAIRHGVAQIAAARLAEMTALLPEGAAACLQRLLEGNRARNAILLGATARLVVALRRAGVRSVVLKGAALAPTVYPEPALRNFADIDILVDADRLEAAAGVLDLCGYGCTHEDLPGSLTLGLMRVSDADVLSGTLAPELVPGHAAHLVEPYRRRIVVELHKGLARTLDGRPRDIDMEPFWRSLREFEPEEGSLAEMLGSEAMLVHLAIHAGEHAFGRLLFPVDAAFLLQRSRTEFSWDGALALAGRCGAEEAVYRLLHLTRQVCGAPVPDEAMTALLRTNGGRLRPIEASTVLAARSAVGSEPRVRRLLTSGTARQRILAGLRIVAQPPHVMREVYGVRSTPGLWICYLLRPFHLAGRAARILLRSAIGARP